ncbi:hypothetical protein PG984_003032 [Apiospora sp. TS-2023a]
MPPTMPSDPTVTPDIGTTTGPPLTKPPRVLACILCQQRKVRCDRIFPCANCVRQGAVCIPSGQIPRERRKRFPEKALLDRLRYYEDLLRQNRIPFAPLHGQSSDVDEAQCNTLHGDLYVEPPESPDFTSAELGTKPEHTAGNKHFLKSFRELDLDNNADAGSDDASDAPRGSQPEKFPKTKTMMSYSHEIHADFAPGFLYGLPDLVPFRHPEKNLLLRLWHTFVRNVHPIMNIIHVPTVQDCVYDVAHDACQQAIWNCDALTINNRDSLAAVFLHMVSVGTRVRPETLHTMLAIALRLAVRLGIYRESTIEKYDVVDAEMCRRLWWSIVKFDHRICEIVCYQSTSLVLAWDCKIPSNIPDSQLGRGNQPATSSAARSSEALFCALSAEFFNTVRQQKPDMGFPLYKSRPKPGSMITSLEALEARIEPRYFASYNADDPRQFMTRWCFRYSVALAKMTSLYTRPSTPSGKRNEATQAELFQYARDAIKSNSQMMGSLPIRGYMWLTGYWPPGLAWMTILHDMKMRPEKDHVQDLWNELSENRAARQDYHQSMGLVDLSIRSLSHVVLETWRSNEEFHQRRGRKLQSPPMIAELEEEVAQGPLHGQSKQPPTHPGNIASVDENMTAGTGYETWSFGMNALGPEMQFPDTEILAFNSQPVANMGFWDDPVMVPPDC